MFILKKPDIVVKMCQRDDFYEIILLSMGLVVRTFYLQISFVFVW